ncbi:hypothetical protein [Phyllobacterium sp. SB3]|uniref:hypothetical protein n=1 Tax=Phyllobacterium sp. SB3 TaxID=3156073 RepID=UPI0032AFCF97
MAWIADTPFGLLAPAAVSFLYVRDRTIPKLYVSLGIAFAFLLLAAMFAAGSARDLLLSWAAFFVLAFCIGIIVANSVAGVDSLVHQRVARTSNQPCLPLECWVRNARIS